MSTYGVDLTDACDLTALSYSTLFWLLLISLLSSSELSTVPTIALVNISRAICFELRKFGGHDASPVGFLVAASFLEFLLNVTRSHGSHDPTLLPANYIVPRLHFTHYSQSIGNSQQCATKRKRLYHGSFNFRGHAYLFYFQLVQHVSFVAAERERRNKLQRNMGGCLGWQGSIR